ncbi:hypothetical protein AK830_g2786 [Neonectria ditissima]|uniref:Uncharacterized protein n=1 Tax=Neonectria ditissima TaxID=78410 RepID=A0A0N8H878_9HYPO|nr:hypothetical protein AK830_g2786 [Neonectria ditissima]
MSSAEAPNNQGKNIGILDNEHVAAFRQALERILATPLAEFTYAQILDGLPTEESLEDSYVYMASHPVYKLGHKNLCGGFLEKARDLMAKFDPSDLRLKQSLDLENQATGDDLRFRSYFPPAAAFFHKAYQSAEQYPRGLADVAEYWAEGKIFGGVVVFDRGETEQECNSMWIYGSDVFDPKTLYPPTQQQFNALVNFLLAGPDEAACPLPIHGTRSNRPRWDPDDAIARYHIFRDKWERKIPESPERRDCVRNSKDWPELDDRNLVQIQLTNKQWGAPVDEEALAAAEERLMQVTPSSPCWNPQILGTEQNEAN